MIIHILDLAPWYFFNICHKLIYQFSTYISFITLGTTQEKCSYQTPAGKLWRVTSDAVLDENDDKVPNVEPLMSYEEKSGCGLNFTKFAEGHYGDWKCMLEKADDSENHGSFRINEPGNWPTDIRLPTDLNVS